MKTNKQTNMLVVCLGLLSFCGAVAWAQDSDCPPGYSGYATSCYAFVDHKMNWADAESTCSALGGFLAEVFTAGENQFLQNLSRNHGSHAVWLGGDDLVLEGQWSWARSGMPIEEFTDWYPGQPEKSSQDDENCLEMNVHSYGGHWNDDECDNEQRFICQKMSENGIIG